MLLHSNSKKGVKRQGKIGVLHISLSQVCINILLCMFISSTMEYLKGLWCQRYKQVEQEQSIRSYNINPVFTSQIIIPIHAATNYLNDYCV